MNALDSFFIQFDSEGLSCFPVIAIPCRVINPDTFLFWCVACPKGILLNPLFPSFFGTVKRTMKRKNPIDFIPRQLFELG